MEVTVSGLRTPDFMQRRFKDAYRFTEGLYLIKGGNGTGKSVFLNSMIGFYGHAPAMEAMGSGQVQVSYFNQDSQAASDSVRWNLFLDQGLDDPSAREAQAMQLLQDFGMVHVMGDLHAEVIPTLLSGGQMKKIGLIRTVLRSAHLYLFDEPTNDLDKQSVKALMSIIEELAQRACIVAITHDAMLESLPHRELNLFHD